MFLASFLFRYPTLGTLTEAPRLAKTTASVLVSPGWWLNALFVASSSHVCR